MVRTEQQVRYRISSLAKETEQVRQKEKNAWRRADAIFRMEIEAQTPKWVLGDEGHDGPN
jgi:hypothetical protein